MSQSRIYVVICKRETGGDDRRLVEAGSAAQAIRHIVRHRYEAHATTPKELAVLMTSGVRVEVALPEENVSATKNEAKLNETHTY